MHPVRYALLAAAVILAGAFFPHHNYNYFVLLRWVVFATAAWAAVVESERKRVFAVVVFCLVAVLHNPFMKFTFHRDTWLALDGLTAVWFAIMMFFPSKKS
jgi:hypothetical protein